jgi:hypothetical protein
MLEAAMSYPWVTTNPSVDEGSGSRVQGSFGVLGPAAERDLRGLAHEIRDEDLERDKAGYRGIFLHELRGILARCDNGDEDDPRWDELRLRCLDRLAKLTRIYEADAPASKQGPGDPRALARQAAHALTELEASLAETRTS